MSTVTSTSSRWPSASSSSKAPFSKNVLKKFLTHMTRVRTPHNKPKEATPTLRHAHGTCSLDRRCSDNTLVSRSDTTWEDVRRRRAQALASVGLLKQSTIYGEPYHDDDDGQTDEEVDEIKVSYKHLRLSSNKDHDDETETLCLCCGTIDTFKSSTIIEMPGECLDGHHDFDGHSVETISDATILHLPESPYRTNSKREGLIFTRDQLEFLPPSSSPVSPISPFSRPSSPLESPRSLRCDKPPRPSLRISIDSFSTSSTLWEQDVVPDCVKYEPKSLACELKETGDADNTVRLRKIKSILVDIKNIEDEETRKLTELAFLS